MVKVLLERREQFLVEWILKTLNQAIANFASGMPMTMIPNDDKYFKNVLHNTRFRLLLSLLKMEENSPGYFQFSSQVILDELRIYEQLIRESVNNPIDLNGLKASKMLYSKNSNQPKPKTFYSDDESGSEPDSDLNSTTTTKKRQLISEEKENRRIEKPIHERAKLAQVKSSLYVQDSSDEENDKEFFNSERLLREKILNQNKDESGADKKSKVIETGIKDRIHETPTGFSVNSEGHLSREKFSRSKNVVVSDSD